jgi:hypothetical protein
MGDSMERSGCSRGFSRWFLLITAIAFCNVANAQRLHRFVIAINPQLTQIDVRACFDGEPPERLVAQSLDAAIALIGAWDEATGKSITPRGYIPLKSVPDSGCITYKADVSRPIKLHDRTGGKIRRVGKDLAAAVGLWLWRPEQLADDEDVLLVFNLPDGHAVSVPWAPVDGTSKPTFRLGHTPYDWPAWVAFGRFTVKTIDVRGSQLRLSVLEGSPPVDIEQIAGWVARSADAVADMYGRFPFSQAQVMVVPNSRMREPAPWAFVVRGGSPAVHFVINQRRPIEEFYSDWTAMHEFSHLFLPFVDSDDAWLSEGIATYYQNVLGARGGRLSVEKAWSHLHAGFGRGEADAKGLTLAQATHGMHRGGHYMRVYWSGAAMMLLADLRLRRMSGGLQSLDTALDALNQCCGQPDKAWTAAELFTKLDEITQSSVFGDLLDEHTDSRRFPDLSMAYRELGLIPLGGDIDLASDAPLAHVRDAIMSGNSSQFTSASTR